LEKGNYSERDAKACMKQLLKGIEYLHSRNIAHRDLKLENLLLMKKNDISRVKIVDFGLAKRAAESHLETICGTPQYVAPEVIQGVPGNKYDPKVDMWSAGVIMFILLGGYPPFYDEHEPRLFQKIRRGLFSFDDPVWNDVSGTAKDLIKKLLVVAPAERLSAAQALAHEWFRDASDVDVRELLATRNNMQTNALAGQISAR
jgi:calcium/calmodulin-dependent protein kinase I